MRVLCICCHRPVELMPYTFDLSVGASFFIFHHNHIKEDDDMDDKHLFIHQRMRKAVQPSRLNS